MAQPSGKIEPFWLKTQNTLGKLLRKPKLVDKYLERPPFAFIHAIVQEVVAFHGIFDGLFKHEELAAPAKVSYCRRSQYNH